MLVNYDALMRIHHTHDGFGSSGVEAYESSCIAHNAANWRRAGTSSIEGPHGVHLRVVRRCDYLDRTVCAVKRSETGKSGFEIHQRRFINKITFLERLKDLLPLCQH
jgi:hypothetical protein